MDKLKELFLFVDGVSESDKAIDQKGRSLDWSISAAMQHNKIYSDSATDTDRWGVREGWKRLLDEESIAYTAPEAPISDDAHCAAIQRVADKLASKFKEMLADGKLRFGTSQKAFNLYLKYLWMMDKIAAPPHCPIDRVVLQSVGIEDSWTHCDSQEQYMSWIHAIRSRLTLSDWEHTLWLRWTLNNSGL